MSDRRQLRGGLPRALALAALAAGVLVLAHALFGGAVASRAALGSATETTPQTDDSLPLDKVTMIGSAPQEADDETWGLGKVEGAGATGIPYELVRYTREGGWSLGPQLLDSTGQPLHGFEPDRPIGLNAPSPLAGQLTPRGSGILVGTVAKAGGGAPQQVVLVRNPGGSFQETAPVPDEGEGALLRAGEQLFASRRAPLVAPLDEADGRAGALVVPVGLAAQDGVLHWDGHEWSREPIEAPGETPQEKEDSGFQVLGIGATSPDNAWLLVQPSSAAETLALYRRVEGVWKPVSGAGELQVEGEALFTAVSPERIESQLITVTGKGVWVDSRLPTAQLAATVFFEPSGTLQGSIRASWCSSSKCSFALPEDVPEQLPVGPSRSIAWVNPSAGEFGERVITGLKEGVSLRLQGARFVRVLALGGSAPGDVGGTFGAAFASATEGWLGNELMPVHLTLDPVASRLSPWPVSFRHALFAIAPQPGAPVGALSSQALAVGDQGEVARYLPGQGWLPESLLGPGGVREKPRLRAVAWPTPQRAYAVGDSGRSSPMWLWRGETGLWEADPAIPLNFRGNLLGIAFEPGNPARGYAVGSEGVLLRFGKTWTQDALPGEASGATFTSIAFAGSEAIVAFRRELHDGGVVGGLLVNGGSGWHVDTQATAAMQTGTGANIPATVAGLPDGGAAVATSGLNSQVFEREGAGGAWHATTVPLPPSGVPGSLAPFRENGALRVIAAGAAPVGKEVIPAPPPGFPPTLEEPAPVPSAEQQRGVVRQTAGGWSDEQHEVNLVKETPGPYRRYDSVYQPDPIDAVLVDPTWSQGWAVGGAVNGVAALDTSDVDRYPADGAQPPGRSTYSIAADPEDATLAIGGGAQCAAPCADRADAGIGPDVWLSNALARARQTIGGLQAFLYTGPRVSAGETEGSEPQFPFANEFARYAELLASANPLAVFAAPSPSDLDERPSGGTTSLFETSLQSAGLAESQLIQEEHAPPTSATGAQYSFTEPTSRGPVRAIVLDDSRNVDTAQREWLELRLGQAAAEKAPAIVVGNADLNAQIAAGNDPEAEAVVRALVQGQASAYFYDAPEQNVATSLQYGGRSIPAYGSGTLGYVSAAGRNAQFQASGFLYVGVEVGQRGQGSYNGTPRAGTNFTPVNVQLIPSIGEGELALEAIDGTLLRTSEVAQFAALARRPRAGNRSQRGVFTPDTGAYVQIPSECDGTACPMRPVYEFTSSNDQVGEFVKRNLAAPEANAVEVDSNGVPQADSQSGLFCAYRAGSTTVTIRTGGMSASLPVVVQAGSQRRPCVPPHPSTSLPSQQQQAPAPPPAPAPTPAGPAPASSPPVVPVPAPPVLPAPAPAQRAVATPPFFIPPALATPVLAFVPPPVPTPARPSPPSGTSAVTSPVEVAEHEEDEEEATESVSNQAVAYRAVEHEPAPVYLLGLVLLAAIAGASARRRRGGPGRRAVRVAPATLNTARGQRRMDPTNANSRPPRRARRSDPWRGSRFYD